MEHFQKAADKGSTEGQYYLGYMFMSEYTRVGRKIGLACCYLRT